MSCGTRDSRRKKPLAARAIAARDPDLITCLPRRRFTDIITMLAKFGDDIASTFPKMPDGGTHAHLKDDFASLIG